MAQSNAISGGQVRSHKPRFKVGDRIQFMYMSKPVEGQIVEDRGSIGVGGRHLYRVVGQAGSVTRVLELPDEELEKLDDL